MWVMKASLAMRGGNYENLGWIVSANAQRPADFYFDNRKGEDSDYSQVKAVTTDKVKTAYNWFNAKIRES